jgi:predicted DNA-binding antitoxin AbrB/MazE fold protein
LTKALETSGLQVRDIKKEYKGIGDVVTFALSGIGLGDCADKQDVEYVLALDIKYGLFDSEAQCGAQIEGQLINTEDSKVVWKNKLSFEGRAGGKHKSFGDGKKAVKKWQDDLGRLEGGIEEAIDGVCLLLEREFADRTAEDIQPLEKLKLKPGGRVKAKIIEHSPQRIVLRLKGGSVRSIPAEELVIEEEQVALSK